MRIREPNPARFLYLAGVYTSYTMKSLICLGIESTAHTFGCGIMGDNGKIYANVTDAYKTEKGGIHPSEARLHHENAKDKVVEQALKIAGLKLNDIRLISFSQGPGLSPCLIVGMKKAKELAKNTGVSLVGVNHCIAHLEIGKLMAKAKEPVLLYPSGANTQVIAYEGGKYRVSVLPSASIHSVTLLPRCQPQLSQTSRSFLAG